MLDAVEENLFRSARYRIPSSVKTPPVSDSPYCLIHGENANPYAVAISVMAANKPKYERMSALSEMESPQLVIDSSGRVRFELELDGYSVVHLRLQ